MSDETLRECVNHEKIGNVISALQLAVTCANKLPEVDNLRFLRATYESIGEKGKLISKQVISSIKQISSRYSVTIQNNDSDTRSIGSVSSLTLDESVFDQTTETTDEGLHLFNQALDNARGIQDAEVPIVGALRPDAARKIGLLKLGKRQPNYLDIEKPQVHFPDYPIDNSNTPFVPPNQTKEAHVSIKGDKTVSSRDAHVQNYLEDLYNSNSSSETSTTHPYKEEIVAAVQRMSQQSFDPEDIVVYKPVDETPFTFITTEEQLFNAAERIKNATEIAVDLENHSVRSFQGFCCLMQISTRREDFVIDTLALRGSIYRALATIFADETTVKVFHGADHDVQWLERDYGIYVVNMFDTGQAARLLKFPSASFSHLLAKYCSLTNTSKKKFQLADWRIRPLPDDMLAYARDDTHYLLYIYDRLRVELLRANLLPTAWERSGLVCHKRYVKIRYNDGMARHLAARHGLGFDRHQIHLLEELCKWRDEIARNEDESLMFIAPLNVLYGIVQAKQRVRSVEGFLKFGFPGGEIPPKIRNHAEELVQLICDALDAKFEDDDEKKSVVREEQTWKSDMEEDQSLKAASHMRQTSVKLHDAYDDKLGVEYLDTARKGNDHSKDAVTSAVKAIHVTPSKSAITAMKRRKSTLFGSDSESSSDEEHLLNTKIAPVKSDDDMRTNVPEPKIIEENKLDISVSEKSVEGAKKVPAVPAVSGSEAQIEEKSLLVDGVSRVQKELKDGFQKLADASKKLSKVNANGTEIKADASKMSVTALEKKHIGEDETIMSIREKYGLKTSVGKRSRERAGIQETTFGENLEPFDYEKARLENANSEKMEVEKPFDPMQRLKTDWKRDQVKVKKRKRGRGKSMTFKG